MPDNNNGQGNGWADVVICGLLLGATVLMYKVSMRDRGDGIKEPVTIFDRLFDIIEGKKK